MRLTTQKLHDVLGTMLGASRDYSYDGFMIVNDSVREVMAGERLIVNNTLIEVVGNQYLNPLFEKPVFRYRKVMDIPDID